VSAQNTYSVEGSVKSYLANSNIQSGDTAYMYAMQCT